MMHFLLKATSGGLGRDTANKKQKKFLLPQNQLAKMWLFFKYKFHPRERT